jgi:hypothetical protein
MNQAWQGCHRGPAPTWTCQYQPTVSYWTCSGIAHGNPHVEARRMTVSSGGTGTWYFGC